MELALQQRHSLVPVLDSYFAPRSLAAYDWRNERGIIGRRSVIELFVYVFFKRFLLLFMLFTS